MVKVNNDLNKLFQQTKALKQSKEIIIILFIFNIKYKFKFKFRTFRRWNGEKRIWVVRIIVRLRELIIKYIEWGKWRWFRQNRL